jgi:rhamnosyltransferase
MRRLAITFFYDENGIIDDYMFYLVSSLSEFVHKNIFVSNGQLSVDAKKRLEMLGAEVVERKNVGFDVWAYKAGIEKIGYDELNQYDELLLLNHTFYGPIFPFSEMFDEMERRQCDFWGITAHKEMIPNPFTNEGVLPRHLNSHFIAVRAPMLHSEAFRCYWQNMPEILSYVDSVLKHESLFTKHFIDEGYVCGVYDDDDAYPSKYPCFINIDMAMERRCPIIKRRLFFHDPIFIEQNAIDLPRALRIMRESSTYDEGMIWSNITRTATLRTLNTNAALTRILPTSPSLSLSAEASKLRVAVCAHIYYVDLLDELLDHAANISMPFDVILTTDSQLKKLEIAARLAQRGGFKQTHVIVLEQNRGRDMSSLFIACRDFFLQDRYDLVLRLHTKKTPQVEGGRGLLFKRHMLENLAGSRGQVDGVLEMFAKDHFVGVAVPPVIHISFPTMGNAWFANKPRSQEVAKMLGLDVKFDASTPVAAYGGMYWFRPAAIRKLFAHKWRWDDFNPEPDYMDGDLSHVLERLICYSAQDAGYITTQILSENQAAQNYAMLEYKLERLSSFMPWNLPWQFHMLQQWKDAKYPTRMDGVSEPHSRLISFSKNIEQENDYTRSIVDRILGHGAELIASATALSFLANDFASANRSDLSHERNLCIESLMGLCSYSNSLFRRNMHRDRKENINAIRIAVAQLESFAASLSSMTASRNEKIVKRRQIIDHLFFGWPCEREMCVLFDSVFYATKYLNNVSTFNPFLYYLTKGVAAQHSPHPLFDPKYYASQVFNRTFENPLIDYLTLGWKERLSPHPLFETSYYLDNNNDVLTSGIEPLTHFLVYGGKEGRSPHWAFDTSFYLDRHPEVAVLGVNPLVDFLLRGANEGCWPNKSFDVFSYLDHHPELKSTGVNPLIHYVEAVRARLRRLQMSTEKTSS